MANDYAAFLHELTMIARSGHSDKYKRKAVVRKMIEFLEADPDIKDSGVAQILTPLLEKNRDGE